MANSTHYPKPPLTGGGRQRKEYANDAPRALHKLALTQVPGMLKGPGLRGAYVRGWCDGVRGLDAARNPYMRGGSGWHHGMAQLYRDGWVEGRRIHRLPPDAIGMTEAQYNRMAEVFQRVKSILQDAAATTCTCGQPRLAGIHAVPRAQGGHVFKPRKP